MENRVERISPRLLQSEPMQRCSLDACRAACCLHGVWVDLAEVRDIFAHAGLIRPHMPPAHQDPKGWFDERLEEDEHALTGQVRHTTVLPDVDHYGGTSCVFLRADYKCALQVAAQEARLHPWRFKPFYCILHPLDFDDQGHITLDETDLLLSEPGSCLRPAAKPVPLIELFAEELRYLLGVKDYRRLISRLPR